MKHLRSFGACMCGLLLLACAGTSPVTTTDTSGGGGATIATTPHIEMIYSPGLGSLAALPTFGDPLNIRTGEQVRFQMVGYTAAGERVVLSANNWRSSDTTNTFGTISNTGVYDAASRQTPGTYLISGTYNGVEYSTEYAIKGRETRVTGMVLSQGTGLPVTGAYIYFYDNNGDFVGIAQSTYDGSFRAALPRLAQRFQIVNDSLSASFFRLIQFNSNAALTTVRPSYLENRNSSGTVVAQSVSTAGTQYRLTGVSQQCKPLLSTTTSLTASDYYLSNPILVVPTTATNGLGAPLDPFLVAEGCTVP